MIQNKWSDRYNYNMENRWFFTMLVLGWLGLFLEVGTDLYFKSIRFTLDGKNLLKKSLATLRMVAGMPFLFELS